MKVLDTGFIKTELTLTLKTENFFHSSVFKNRTVWGQFFTLSHSQFINS